jgi:hypothetical protein
MARSYGVKFKEELAANEATTLGVTLGKLCVEARIPAAYIAAALNTTGTTVYSWFRGQGIREGKRQIVEVMIDFIKEDLANKILPVATQQDAKKYIESIMGKPIEKPTGRKLGS